MILGPFLTRIAARRGPLLKSLVTFDVDVVDAVGANGEAPFALHELRQAHRTDGLFFPLPHHYALPLPVTFHIVPIYRGSISLRLAEDKARMASQVPTTTDRAAWSMDEMTFHWCRPIRCGTCSLSQFHQPLRRSRPSSASAQPSTLLASGRTSALHRVPVTPRIMRLTRSQGCCQARSGSTDMAWRVRVRLATGQPQCREGRIRAGGQG